MAENVLPILLVLVLFGLIIVLLRWAARGTLAQERLRESLFRNVGVPYRNLIGLSLGATASLLSLSSNTWTVWLVTWIFVVAIVFTMVLLVAVRPSVEKDLDRFAWGLLPIIVLGFGLGGLIYQARPWWSWLWRQYRRIDQPHELVLEFLFILGLILGVFVVRNWGKEQKAFTESLTGVLSGTFVAAIFGESLKEQGLTPMRALTFYGLGFVISAALNLPIAAYLTANYTNKRSITSRAILDFLYGSERAKIIDGYFLKNFEDDTDYAKQRITETLIEFRKLVQYEFAEQLEQRRKNRERDVEDLRGQFGDVHPACSKLATLQEELPKVRGQVDALTALPEPRAAEIQVKLQKGQEKLQQLGASIRELENTCTSDRLKRWKHLVLELRKRKPSYFYELMAIECEEDNNEANGQGERDETKYRVVYKHIGSKITPKIEGAMFRVGVSARWQDSLEYVTAPGEYRAPFPYQGSVAGLALLFRQTIVMNRDLNKRFRNKQFTDGICPKDIQQNRGLDIIDYLSYAAIPIVSRPGSPSENPVGVLTIDTRIFVTPIELTGEPINASEGIFALRMTKAELLEYANTLYEVEDEDVVYIEKLTRIITPVLELYSKCRVGAI